MIQSHHLRRDQLPKITVITPVYNCERYICETIESVLKFKEEFDLELIVVNDGSTDETYQKIQPFQDSIRIVNQANYGEAAAVNVGISMAQSEILLVVSADDPLFTSELFSGVSELFDLNPELVAAYCDWKKIDQNGDLVKVVYLPDFSLELLLGRSQCLPGPGTFFRRSSALEIGGRDIGWRFVGDFDFWLRLTRLGEIVHRPVLAAQWREHEFSTSIRFRGIDMASERVGVVEDFITSVDFALTRKLKRMALGNAYYLAARLCYFDPRVRGKYFLLKAFSSRKKWPENAKIHEVVYILLKPLSHKIINFLKGLT